MSREYVHEHCRAEGLSIMAEVFDIIMDRDDGACPAIVAAIEGGWLSPENAYDTFIGPAIDRLESWIIESS